MTGIYIDDTGTPGMKSKSHYDAPDKKTWIALILTSEQRKEAYAQMSGCIDEIKTMFNATEFHFTDIYSGKREFKNVELSIRLGIFQAFAEILRQMQYPMLIQTFTFDDMLRSRIVISDKKLKVDNFKLSDPSDFALFFLLFRIKKYLQENKHVPLPVEIIIDEGRQKKNTTQKCELLKGYLHNSTLVYKSSSEDHLLQLIDFVAFSVNKVRWIMTNDRRSEIDSHILEIFERADFNILNINKQLINFNEYTVEDYDKVLREVYDKNNNLSEFELEEFKKKLYE